MKNWFQLLYISPTLNTSQLCPQFPPHRSVSAAHIYNPVWCTVGLIQSRITSFLEINRAKIPVWGLFRWLGTTAKCDCRANKLHQRGKLNAAYVKQRSDAWTDICTAYKPKQGVYTIFKKKKSFLPLPRPQWCRENEDSVGRWRYDDVAIIRKMTLGLIVGINGTLISNAPNTSVLMPHSASPLVKQNKQHDNRKDFSSLIRLWLYCIKYSCYQVMHLAVKGTNKHDGAAWCWSGLWVVRRCWDLSLQHWSYKPHHHISI